MKMRYRVTIQDPIFREGFAKQNPELCRQKSHRRSRYGMDDMDLGEK